MKNSVKFFQFAAGDTPAGVETSKPMRLQERIGGHVIIGHRDTGTASVEYSADGGTTWSPVDNDGTPLVLTDTQAYPVLPTYAFRVNNLTGTGQCYLNNPFYE